MKKLYQEKPVNDVSKNKGVKPKKSMKKKTNLRKSDSISDIYHRAKSKLPSIGISTNPKPPAEPQEVKYPTTEKVSLNTSSRESPPAMLVPGHREIYFNIEFQDQSIQSHHSIINRPLPPVPH